MYVIKRASCVLTVKHNTFRIVSYMEKSWKTSSQSDDEIALQYLPHKWRIARRWKESAMFFMLCDVLYAFTIGV